MICNYRVATNREKSREKNFFQGQGIPNEVRKLLNSTSKSVISQGILFLASHKLWETLCCFKDIDGVIDLCGLIAGIFG